MKKVLSFFILLFIFSCTSSDNPIETDNSIIPGKYSGSMTITLSQEGEPSKVVGTFNKDIIFNNDGSISSDIFDNDTIPADILKKQSNNTYYGVYNHSFLNNIYEITIKVIDKSTISVNIVVEETNNKEYTTYTGNLSRQ